MRQSKRRATTSAVLTALTMLAVSSGCGWSGSAADDAAGATEPTPPVTVPASTTAPRVTTATTSTAATTSTSTTSTSTTSTSTTSTSTASTSTATSTTTTTSLPPTTTLAPTTTITLPPATTPPATTLPPTTPPATTPPTLPQPIDAPLDTDSTEARVELGGIEIPRLGLTRSMFEGIRIPTLDNGPGHWPGTAMPGQLGNVVVAGHRVSNNQDFRHIDQLEAGDEVVFTTAAGRFVYLVESTEIVGPDAIWIVDQTPEYRATLFACHPPGSVAERIVVHLRLRA